MTDSKKPRRNLPQKNNKNGKYINYLNKDFQISY